MSNTNTNTQANKPGIDRRGLMKGAGAATLSTAALLLLGGRGAQAASHEMPKSADSDILNVALRLEHEAINAYQLGAESGLLEKPVLDLALVFQGHHKAHRDALAATIEQLGGTPVDALALGEYATSLGAGGLKSQADVLGLASKLELGATNAYLSVIPSFADSELAKIAGRLAADEAMHWTTLNSALGETIPNNALSFGA